jgi:murein DD-endopeptidase MepM/ murein hydrolase activator NlpD
MLFGSGVAAFGLVPGAPQEEVPTQMVLRELANPLALTRKADDMVTGEHYWREERIARGDTLGNVLARLGVDDPEALLFLGNDPTARPIYDLQPGRPLRAEIDGAGRLVQLRFIASNGELFSVSRDDEQLTASSGPAPADVQWQMASGQIQTSLFDAADAIDLPDAVTLQLADVFAGDIDVYNDLRRGDRFAVVYEKRYVDGEAVGAGRIIAAEFTNSGKTFRAFLWRDANGSEAYYGADGAARRAAFLRSPMQYSRITSGFSHARFHPILHTWRAHKGVDYGAPMGTPVRATGDGEVVFAGLQNGYGNVIEVKHHGAFSTLYAHLSDFAPQVEFGAQVAQGDVIGFVGQTGYATGPHLHYEFRVDDEQRDPAAVALPDVEPLSPAKRRAFIVRIKPALAELELARALPGPVLASAQ